VAIVTGGATGIGAAVVRELAGQGARCVINYAHSRDEAQALTELIRDEGGEAIAVKADIVEDSACRALAAKAIEAFGRIDFLVNNAGRTKFADHEDLEALSAEDFVDIYRLNTVAAFQMVRACAPAMREQDASAVVNVASVAGVFGNGSSVAYAASKGALITMTKSLARVLAPAIRVNAVAPGAIATPLVATAPKDFLAGLSPMGRIGSGADIADAVLYLTEARNVTGVVLPVDGGAHL
jgi:3-oxoacyl-[acyl-carrier protein] reductase